MSAAPGDRARKFNWLLDSFVEGTSGVTDAVAVSSDGLLIAASRNLEREDAEQVSAIVSAFVSLAQSTSRCFDFDGLQQVIVAMKGGYLFVSSISDGSAMGVVAVGNCDIGGVGYQIALLVERVGPLLTPALITELRQGVMA